MSSRNRLRRVNTEDGFVLVEIAVAVFVLALLLGSVLPLLRAETVSARSASTDRRMAAVMAVLAAELARSGHLPCPASGTDGIAQAACSGAVTGQVPAASLGLPAAAVQDGWSRPFTYAVDARATQTVDLADWCGRADGFDVLTLEGASPQHPVVLLVAHGPGGGAWLAGGGRAPGTASEAETENADDDGVFAVVPFVASGPDRFDDRILAYAEPAFTSLHGIHCPAATTGPGQEDQAMMDAAAVHERRAEDNQLALMVARAAVTSVSSRDAAVTSGTSTSSDAQAAARRW